MTNKITKILSAVALMAFAVPVTAAPHSSADLSAALEVMALGNPHAVHQIALADETSREGKPVEDQRHAELSNWEALFGREPFPGMGVGGHGR